MEDESKLIQLVEQAACNINMLSPTDPSDVQALQEILRQIGEAAGSLDQGPVELRQQLEGTTAQTAEVLQHILQQDVQDTAQALNTVAQAICVLQGLIGQLAPPATEAGPAPSPVPPAPASEPSVPGALTISEEDAPLVLDFITESHEHVETAEAALLELENRPADGELINKIFRAFHTIKGIRALWDQSPRRQARVGPGSLGQAAARRPLPDVLRIPPPCAGRPRGRGIRCSGGFAEHESDAVLPGRAALRVPAAAVVAAVARRQAESP